MPGRRNLPGTALRAVPWVARAYGEEQNHPGEKPSQVDEPGCLPSQGLGASGRSPPGRRAAHELDDELQAEDEEGRDAHDPDEEA